MMEFTNSNSRICRTTFLPFGCSSLTSHNNQWSPRKSQNLSCVLSNHDMSLKGSLWQDLVIGDDCKRFLSSSKDFSCFCADLFLARLQGSKRYVCMQFTPVDHPRHGKRGSVHQKRGFPSIPSPSRFSIDIMHDALPKQNAASSSTTPRRKGWVITTDTIGSCSSSSMTKQATTTTSYELARGVYLSIVFVALSFFY